MYGTSLKSAHDMYGTSPKCAHDMYVTSLKCVHGMYGTPLKGFLPLSDINTADSCSSEPIILNHRLDYSIYQGCQND